MSVTKPGEIERTAKSVDCNAGAATTSSSAPPAPKFYYPHRHMQKTPAFAGVQQLSHPTSLLPVVMIITGMIPFTIATTQRTTQYGNKCDD